MTDDLRALAAQLLASSPYTMTLQEAQAHIAERRKKLLAAPPNISTRADPDFTAPAPMPVLDAPESFATDFWSKRKVPGVDDEPPKRKPKKPRGRKPVGDLPARANRFRIIDGDGDNKS